MGKVFRPLPKRSTSNKLGPVNKTLPTLPTFPNSMYQGRDPLRHVVSANIHRRHLNETQRAVLALKIEEHEAEAAAQRMLAGKRNPEELVPQGGAPMQGRARDRAGAAVGVSGR